MFIVREPCLKTERTRTQTEWKGKSIVLHFGLLDKIGLEESIRLLFATLLACFLCRCVCERVKREKWTKGGGKARKMIVCFWRNICTPSKCGSVVLLH